MTYEFDPRELRKRFFSQTVDEKTYAKQEEVRATFYNLAVLIAASCPPGRERDTALTHLETSSFFTMAGMSRACGEKIEKKDMPEPNPGNVSHR